MKQPNLVFIFPDQMRGQAMRFLGEEKVETPNLDKFSKESLVLDSASATYPVCSPYRAMLMTGKYPFSNKVLGNCTSVTAPFNVHLQEKDKCWSDILKEKDYSLGYIGKWHLDSPHEPYVDCYNNKNDVKWNEWCPPKRRHGFDFWYSYGTYDRHLRPMYWSNDAKRDEFHFVDQWGPEHEADLAIEYINNTNNKYRDNYKPFGLVVAMNPPHSPYHMVPERYLKIYDDISIDDLCSRPNIPEKGTKMGDYYRENIKKYFAMITGVDEQFGRIVEAIENAGIKENTIVVFTADHGNCLGIHNNEAKNVCFEESIRIPFMIRWPKHIEPRIDNLLISAPDVYPTLMELMGVEESMPDDIEGTSYAKLFMGKEQTRPTSQFCMGKEQIRLTSQFCMKHEKNRTAFSWRAIRNNQYTYVVSKDENKNSEKIILFNNIKDKYQLNNIASENPAVVAQLQKKLNQWQNKIGDK